MTIKVYQPQIKITLIKVIARHETSEGVQASSRHTQTAPGERIDLTSYLGDGSSIRTSKSVKAPAGGFAIVLTDKPDFKLETIYSFIEPMDIIEIRIAHDAVKAGEKLPLIMRGFVSRVARSEGMGGDGRPVRRVVIRGQDYGKLWQVLQIIYRDGTPLGESILTGFAFLHRYNSEFDKSMTLKEAFGKFINDPHTETVNNRTRTFNGILQDWLEKMLPWTQSMLPELSKMHVDCRVPGRIAGQLIGEARGGQSLYSLMAYLFDVDAGFNELYTEDTEKGTNIILRPVPWKTKDGKFIQAGAWADPVEVNGDDVIDIASERSDESLANTFFVWSPAYSMLHDYQVQQRAQGLEDAPNNTPIFYGVRQLETTINTAPPGWIGADGATDAQAQAMVTPQERWVEAKKAALVAAMADSVILERGEMHLRGNPKIKAGMYLKLKRRGLTAEYYVENVEHDFKPYQGFTTTVYFARGTGFAERLKQQKSPYLLERDEKGI